MLYTLAMVVGVTEGMDVLLTIMALVECCGFSSRGRKACVTAKMEMTFRSNS
jgi:hypothetical protein